MSLRDKALYTIYMLKRVRLRIIHACRLSYRVTSVDCIAYALRISHVLTSLFYAKDTFWIN